MDRAPIWVLLISILLIFPVANSEEENVKQGLLKFMGILSAGNQPTDPSWGWSNASDPCNGTWKGLTCKSQRISKLVLEELNFTGQLDASSLCISSSLTVLSLRGNGIVGLLSEDIGNCRSLTRLSLSGNHFSGGIPVSLSRLGNLKKLDMSNNEFSGEIPDLSRISGLLIFVVQNNLLSGPIPDMDFANLQEFNVSNNNFSGPIPDVKGKFPAESFVGNIALCGSPLPNACPPSAPALAPPPFLPSEEKRKLLSKNQILMYSGYIILAAIVLLLIALKLFRKMKHSERNIDVVRDASSAQSYTKSSDFSTESKTPGIRSEYSITSAGSRSASASLKVLSSPAVRGLKFEDLLRASAELLSRGKHGSVFKVRLDNGMILAVKRIKDLNISREEFTRRMQRIDQVKHPGVLPAVAFYCSNEEKLLIYEYQQNGGLFNLLQGSETGHVFDWGSRLNIAQKIAEALTFMHEELQNDGIAHGNLKSTNILFNKRMEPSISEYGLMVDASQGQSFLSPSDRFKQEFVKGDHAYSAFKVDVYSFGMILLELLTGKAMQHNGFDLANWVHTAVREEWTVEVFDKALISEGASEERMVNLLQVALKCINPSPNERPNISHVAVMINTLKEEEERSMISEP
ncbi:hypothetical protein K2173_022796 [Erythroxylum novogranatense]|uniref:Protein kinase domain-containing protein n=1 Tax=Erythroxylum novogranatense TaxID=1862640 RepID=A0AAV8SNT4_9ROSI|nr:hypothetical protein K2173_022796 [Erythroxylum novogranatense]